MKLKEMANLFDKHIDAKFEHIPANERTTNRRDLFAFILLDQLFPGPADGFNNIVTACEHDQLFLDIDTEMFLSVATEDLIKKLSACGVFYDQGYDSFSMFR